MSRLIFSTFTRLLRNFVFWILLVCLFAFGMYSGYSASSGLSDSSVSFALDGFIFEYVPIMGIVTAIFVSLFVGTEYSDGTIRNKLVGHSRSAVYISNLIVCAIAVNLFSVAYISAVLLVGNYQNGSFLSDTSTMLFFFICSLFTTTAFAGLMTFLAMLNSNKAGNVVISMILSLLLLVFSSFIYQRLSEPEQYDKYISVNSSGIPTQVEREPNPLYIDGAQRKVFELLNDCLPSGQAIQLANAFDAEGLIGKGNIDYPYMWLLYAGILTILISALGILVFKNKEIK